MTFWHSPTEARYARCIRPVPEVLNSLAVVHWLVAVAMWSVSLAKKQDLSAESSYIWATQKGNRLRVLTVRLEEVEAQIELLHEHARREWELISGVDPEASPVPLNNREYLAYVKEQRALLREIADQTGQLPQRIAADVTVAKSPLTAFDTLVMTEDGQLHGVVNP